MSQTAKRSPVIAGAILAAIALATGIAAINRDALSAAYHGTFTFGPHRQALLESLKDADSAKFRGEFLTGDYLCGEVNAKNSYGAYPGFVRFISSRSGFSRMDSGSLLFDEHWRRHCGRS